MDSDTFAESEMSLESRSFLYRVNDWVRKRQNQSSKNATKDSDKHSVIWRLFMSSTLQASVFMEKNYSDTLHCIKNTEDLTMKQMFDISGKLKTEQSDEIYGMSRINWEHSMEVFVFGWWWTSHQSLVHKGLRILRFCMCLGKMNENPLSNYAWEDRLTWFKSSPEYRALDRIDGEPMEFEWNIFPGFTTLQLCHKVQELLSRLSVTREKFTGRMARGMGSRRQVRNRPRRTREGPELACVQTLTSKGGTAGEKGWINILPWYRLVGVAIFLVKRKLQEYYVLLNRRQMLREWHTTWHMFHSEIGAQSVLRVVDEVLRTDELWWTRQRIHCRNSRQTTRSFEQWHRAKLSHVSHSWKRAVQWWSASCSPGKEVMWTWRRKSCDIWSSRFP